MASKSKKTAKTPKKAKAAKGRPGAPPLKTLLGWLEADSAKDARAYARGVVARSFLAHEESWYAVMPFYGGYLWEAHEGGEGKGYIKAAAKALDDMPGGEFWFPSGERVYRIVLQDARPFPHLLPVEKSIEIMNSGVPPLEPGFSMTPYVRKGTGWLVSGSIMSSTAVVFFLGSVAFYAMAYNPGPSVRAVDIPTMPHMQWPLVAKTGVEQIVSKLYLKNGKEWNVEARTHHIDGLDELRKQRADLERSNRDNALVADTAAKAEQKAQDASDERDLMNQINGARTAAGLAPVPVPDAPDTANAPDATPPIPPGQGNAVPPGAQQPVIAPGGVPVRPQGPQAAPTVITPQAATPVTPTVITPTPVPVQSQPVVVMPAQKTPEVARPVTPQVVAPQGAKK